MEAAHRHLNANVEKLDSLSKRFQSLFSWMPPFGVRWRYSRTPLQANGLEVSILVLMDAALRQSPAASLLIDRPFRVSILVLVDAALRQLRPDLDRAQRLLARFQSLF